MTHLANIVQARIGILSKTLPPKIAPFLSTLNEETNADFWVTQPITFEYEQGLFNCGTQMECGNYTASIVGTVVEATFTCTPI